MEERRDAESCGAKKTIINIEVKRYLGPRKEPSNGEVSGVPNYTFHLTYQISEHAY